MRASCLCARVVGLLVGALNRVFADHEMTPIASSAVVAGMKSIIFVLRVFGKPLYWLTVKCACWGYGVPAERIVFHSVIQVRAVLKTTGAIFPAMAPAAASILLNFVIFESSQRNTSAFIALFSA